MLNKVLASLSLLATVSSALADDVTPAVRAEATALAREYAGAPCRSGYELDIDSYARPLSTAQIRAKRDEIYREWKSDLAEDAREDGHRYQIRYTGNRVWAWQQHAKTGQREFKVVTVIAGGERELGCKL